MAPDAGKPDLVFGASGYIGTNLVEYLLGEGRQVRASARNTEVLLGRSWDGAELCRADALVPADLDALASPKEQPKLGSFGYVFSGAEYNTAVWVAKGLVDAGVLSESNWRDRDTVPAEFIDSLSIIAASSPMPRAVEVVRRDLDPATIDALRNALFAMHEDETALPALSAYQGTARFDPLTADDEAVLARIAESLPAFREQFP